MTRNGLCASLKKKKKIEISQSTVAQRFKKLSFSASGKSILKCPALLTKS